MARNKLAVAAATLLGTLMLVVSAIRPALAATVPANNNALKVSPVRTDITIEPGHSKTVPVWVQNITQTVQTLQAIENDFVAGDENGTPSIILDADSYAPEHSLKRFMQPLGEIVVQPNERKQVDVVISVPADAQAGGYFGALRFQPVGSTGTQSVNLASSVAALILLTVPGDLIANLTLTDFTVQQKGEAHSSFRTPDHLEVYVRLTSKGNVQVSPFGQIYVKKGGKVVYTSSFNSTRPEDVILPDGARRWSIPLKNIGGFGKYTVGATFSYGNSGKSINVTKTIWIIPTGLIIAAVGGIVLLVLLVIGIRLYLRAYKRRILRTHQR